MGPESDARIHSRQLQMASVIAPLAKAVVPLVINGAEFTRPSFITPKPFNELRFDLGQFRLRGDRLGVIEDAPLTRRLVNLVVDQWLMEVQGALYERDCIHSISAPGLRGLDRIARPEVGTFDLPDAQVFDVFHTAVELRDDLANEVTNNIRRNPTRSEPRGDLFRAERSWLHGFERVDVLLKARIERRRCLRLFEFRDHIAGEIFISDYPTARGRLKNQPAQRIGRIASRLPGQRGDAVEIYMAALVQ